MNKSAKELGKKVAVHFKQDFEGAVEGPHQIGPYVVSRVWTHDREQDEYHAHYAVEHDGKCDTVSYTHLTLPTKRIV